jgi:hypothetical protein
MAVSGQLHWPNAGTAENVPLVPIEGETEWGSRDDLGTNSDCLCIA